MGTVFACTRATAASSAAACGTTGTGPASLSIIIDGPSGRVNWREGQRQQSGGALYGCLNGVMRGMKFPTLNGPRTRAEFDIAL